jgi:hypothetical protein
MLIIDIEEYIDMSTVFEIGNLGDATDIAFFETTNMTYGFNGGSNVTYVMNDNLAFDNVENYTTIVIDNNNVFDGNGKVIYLQTTSFTDISINGLFNVVNGTIKNLTVTVGNFVVLNANQGYIASQYAGANSPNVCTIYNSTINCIAANLSVSSVGCMVGSHAGTNNGKCELINCLSSFGTLSGTQSGGMVGEHAGAFVGNCGLYNCQSNGTLSSNESGGLVGANAGINGGNCRIIACSHTSSGALLAVGYGLIVGAYAGATFGNCLVEDCSSYFLDIQGTQCGGVVGERAGENAGNCTIKKCSASFTNITGASCGGIVGGKAGESGTCDISKCTSVCTGSISGSESGGIAGVSAGFTGTCNIMQCQFNGVVNSVGGGGIAGAYAGTNFGDCNIYDCISNCNITADEAGGIAGQYAGADSGDCDIRNCVHVGDVNGGAIGGSGGIVGANAGDLSGRCVIRYCKSESDVLVFYAGGIAGRYAGINGYCKIFNCEHDGILTTETGGIVGWRAGNNSGNIIVLNCCHRGNITGDESGGIAANSIGGSSSTSKIYNCVVSSCTVTGSFAGGIIGRGAGNISSIQTIVSHCIFAGVIDSSVISTSGAIIGANSINVEITDCFYNSLNSPNIYNTGTSITSTNNNPTTSLADIYSSGYIGSQIFLRSAPNPHPITITSDSYGFTDSNDHEAEIFGTKFKQAYLSSYSKKFTVGTFNVDTYLGSLPSNETIVVWLPNANKNIPTSYKAYNQSDDSLLGNLVEYKNGDFDNNVDSNIYTITLDFGSGSIPIDFYIQDESNVLTPSNTGNATDKIFFETTVVGHGFNGASNTTYTMNNNLILNYVEYYTPIEINNDNIFDGNGFTITLRTKSESKFNGLFNVIRGQVINLHVVYDDDNLIVLNDNCGWISGPSAGNGSGNYCIIENCFVNAVNFYTMGVDNGGIVGSDAGSFDGSCTVRSCYSSFNLYSNVSGGICGPRCGSDNGNCELLNCYHIGIVYGNQCGGMIPLHSSSGGGSGKLIIENCFHGGNINGNNSGGIVGSYFGYINPYIAKIFNSVSVGEIGGYSSGGIVGSYCGGSNTVGNCLISHSLSVCTIDSLFSYHSGAFMGDNSDNATIQNCFYDQRIPLLFSNTSGSNVFVSNIAFNAVGIKDLDGDSIYVGSHVILRYQNDPNKLSVTSGDYTFSNDNQRPSTSHPTKYEQSYLSDYSEIYTVASYNIDTYLGLLPGLDNVVFWIPNANNSEGNYKAYNALDDSLIGNLSQYKNGGVDNSNDSNIYTATIDFGSGSSPMDFYIQNFSIVCVHKDTNVFTNNGHVKIENIRSNNIVFDDHGNEHIVVNNIKLNVTNEYISIAKDSFGKNKPINDLLIRDGHPLLIDGNEIECQKLINGNNIKRVILDNKDFIYTLVTHDRVFVNMEGLYVCTWQSDEWNTYSKVNKIPYEKL